MNGLGEKIGCVFWGIVMVFLLLTTEHPLLYGVLTTAGIILFALIISKIVEPKTNLSSSSKTTSMANHGGGRYIDRDIDRNYFEQISKVVDDLM